MILPISVVIPTRNRAKVLMKTLDTFYLQSRPIAEIIIVDGSDTDETRDMLSSNRLFLSGTLMYVKADVLGAAAQRNQGVSMSSHPFILFADDDVYLESDCIVKLWRAMEDDKQIGGVSAMITNQKYLPMGKLSTFVATLLNGTRLDTFAGKCLIPGWGMLPEDRDELPEYVPVEWLNLGATLYRKEALPNPPFQSHFVGYSIMEDITLSLGVAKTWKLLNARTSRIYHDSQPGVHKSSAMDMSRMEIRNRYYVMTIVMGKGGIKNHLKFVFFQAFGLIAGAASLSGIKQLPAVLMGKFLGIFDLIRA